MTLQLAEGLTADTAVEENTLLLDAAARDDQSCNAGANAGGGDAAAGGRVRRRLAVCLFLHIVGVAVVTQVYPRVSHTSGDRPDQTDRCDACHVCWWGPFTCFGDTFEVILYCKKRELSVWRRALPSYKHVLLLCKSPASEIQVFQKSCWVQ